MLREPQMVPKEGLEPSRFLRRRFLNPLRLPIPPLRHGQASMPDSVYAVERKLLLVAPVPRVVDGLEYRAAGHGRRVDVQADGRAAAARIADGVIFVRRDQAAGRAGAGFDGSHRVEPVAVAVAFEQFVLRDFQGAVPYAFHAPQAVVVVDRRALSGGPGHGRDRVAVVLAAV